MSEPFIGELRLFAGNFAPRGWAFCLGQLVPISQNTALFSLLGTTYGGDGRTTFGLPDLSDRVPIGQGRGPGLSDRGLGDTGGAAEVRLTAAQLPAHTHPAASGGAVTNRSTDAIPAHGGLYTGSLPEGPGEAHNNRPPYLGVNYIIALVGVFPSRS